MGWIIFCIASLLITLFSVPLKHWEKLWPAGIISLLVILPIDSTLAALNAFKFSHIIISIFNLPLFYWLAYFAGGIFFAYYRPPKKWWSIVFVACISFAYLLVELASIYAGYFYYINWHPISSFFVNMGGFMVFFWLIDWLESIMYLPSKFSQSSR